MRADRRIRSHAARRRAAATQLLTQSLLPPLHLHPPCLPDLPKSAQPDAREAGACFDRQREHLDARVQHFGQQPLRYEELIIAVWGCCFFEDQR